MAQDKRIFRRSEVDVNWREHGDDWGADVLPGTVFRLDCVWWFGLKREARAFLKLVDSGMEPRQASGEVTGYFG